MTTIDDLPYLEAAGHGGPRSRTDLVVIHATGNPRGASAEDEAQYAHERRDDNKTSAHIYVDDDSAVRGLPLGIVAWGCYSRGNAVSVQFELTSVGDASPTPATQMRAAPLVAEVCRRYGIPIRKLTADQVRAGERGICGHGDVTQAWHQGNHMDPGPMFAWGDFMRYVSNAAGAVPGGPPPAYPSYPGYTLYLRRPPMRTSDVGTWQARMSVRGWRIAVDGIYGPQSERVCRAFQAEKGLHVDGIVGPITWRASWEAPITP
jgi:peptidoglycan hydrolase-like protein with peptidoglycan-binding domain